MNHATERLRLKYPDINDAGLLLDYEMRNREFLLPWLPERAPDFYTLDSIKDLISSQKDEIEKRKALYFYIIPKSENKIIGIIGFSNIVYGPFQSCFLAYRLDCHELNRGYATEALRHAVMFLFSEYHLHRIEANVMPGNNPSKHVLQKLGFEYEGMSRKYLKINGIWEDHEHYVILNPDVE
ncbi:GNAT family N-acetyltransferase [bacterium]|nr:GNAT family N-acetyltransferase [candidate division CSSED10-310 bacterium]